MRRALRHHEALRKISLYLGIIGFGFFIQGMPEAALWIRMGTELCRLPSFRVMRMNDQVRLSVLILIGCVYGIYRIRS